MPRFETPRLQMAIFQTVITVASGHNLWHLFQLNLTSEFRTWETEHFKMPRFETPSLQTALFQTVITVASGLIGDQSISFQAHSHQLLNMATSQ